MSEILKTGGITRDKRNSNHRRQPDNRPERSNSPRSGLEGGILPPHPVPRPHQSATIHSFTPFTYHRLVQVSGQKTVDPRSRHIPPTEYESGTYPARFKSIIPDERVRSLSRVQSMYAQARRMGPTSARSRRISTSGKTLPCLVTQVWDPVIS